MSTLEIMQQVKEGKLTELQAAQMIESQSAAAVKEAKKKKATIKVSVKGGIQIDGLRRFPITLYRDEYEIIDGMRDEFKAFIEANKSRLAVKGND
jgi:hypothetical protein